MVNSGIAVSLLLVFSCEYLGGGHLQWHGRCGQTRQHMFRWETLHSGHRRMLDVSGFYHTETMWLFHQTPKCPVTWALKMKHWSPRQQQEPGVEWRLCMSSRPGRSGLPALPWQPVCGAWSRPTNALRYAVSRWSGTTSCFTTALLALVSEEQEPRKVRLVGRCHGISTNSWSGALWSTRRRTRCFWSGREGDNYLMCIQ